MKKLLPLIVLALGICYLADGLRAPKNTTDFDLAGFSRLPALLNGRIKPLDTVARNTLLTLQGRQLVNNPEMDHAYVDSPIEWLLNVIYRPELADTYTTFRIDNRELLGLIGKTGDDLKVKYTSSVKQSMTTLGFLPSHHSRFSYNDLAPHLDEIDRQTKLANSTDSKFRTPFQRAVLALSSNVSLYQRLKYSFVPPDSTDFYAELMQFQGTLAKSVEAAANREAGKPYDTEALKAASDAIRRYQALADFAYVHPVSALDPAHAVEWRSVGQGLLDSYAAGEVPYEIMTYAALGKAWRENQPARFNEVIRLFRRAQEKLQPSALRKTDLEVRFNVAEPFYRSLNLYALAFFLAVFSWLRWADTLGRSAFYLVALAFVATTAGMLARMWIGGYAPVTNLYSSALFVGWVAGGLCLALEAIYRNAIGSVAAGMIGVGTLIIAHHLSIGGDTMEMMRAVLDSNFWLSTHVITVTTGYGATLLAGFLAIIYVLRGLLTKSMDKATADALARMVYGIVCFATLFSLVGTILGGIWADQSWGRFWGWDPKENGALIIVIWNAIILHARWGGMVRQRGLMILAIFGNVVTGWSWFGTNLLEVGLHSYGFTSSGRTNLIAFVILNLAIIGLALIPLKNWRSFRGTTA
jgi:ABC-type transport system involved in cytochrome c biogenesis permease subunit